jgi:hypothetical protein
MKKLSLCLVVLLGAGSVLADEHLTASKDSFLTQGSPNTNEGGNPILRLQASGNNRAVLGFDLSGIPLEGLQQATLVLTISDISNNWGTTGRPVRVHRLLQTFAEGNGWNVGGNAQGSGAGVTWKCATDDDISNSATNCGAVWDGGSFAVSTAASVIHTNGMTGEVSFDVTQDVAALGTGALEAVFLVKKENEGQSGEVEYFSREAAAAAGNMSLAPKLILVTATPNEPPTAVDDEALTARNRPVTLDVLANDSDPNNDPISLVSVSDPSNGTASIDSGKVIYTPDTDFLGSESFTYVVVDNEGAQATGTVSVTVGNPTLTTFSVVKDSYLRHGAPNTNEGSSTFLRVRESGDNAALLGFELSNQDVSGLLTARLVLTIQETGNNWGSGRVIRAHRLLGDWTEGNGFNAGGNTRGTGTGVTWNCASDQDVSDQTPDCLEEWDGGVYAPSTAEGFVVTSGMTGEVSFDVTLDVKAGASFGWVVRKEEENQPGRVEFESKESAPNLAARLILERIDLGNLPPVAEDDFAETFESTEVSIDVLANDFDPNGNALTVTAVSDPANGTAVVEVDQTVDYTPDSGFVGTDEFTYTISDGNGETDTATVTVEVQAGPPPALDPVDDVATTNQGESVLIDVLANDEGLAPLRVIAVTDPPNGTSTIAGTGETLTYKPDSGFTGTDSFEYTVEDGEGTTAAATVTVTVQDVEPVAADDDAATASGIPVVVDVLSNDTGDGIEVTLVENIVGGIATHDGFSVTYTPQPDFVGVGGFDYTIEDVDGMTATAHVSVTVFAPEPVAADDAATTDAEEAVVIAVLSNDTGVGLSVSVTSSPSNGTAVVNAGNTVTYTPNAGFSGTDSFVYTVTDVAAQVDSASVTVRVTPSAVDDSATTIAGVAVSVPVLANDVGTGLAVTAVTQPSNGSAQIQGSTVQYTPNGGFTGSDFFSYTVTDGSGQMSSANVTVTVEPPPNQNPVAVDDAAVTFEAVPVDIAVLSNDTDPDGDALTLSQVGAAANGGTAVLGALVRYTPNPGFDGVDSFPYTISDGRGGSATATVTVTVQDDPTPPVMTAAVDPAPNANGWNDTDVTVTFSCEDGESGIESCPDPVTVTTEGLDQTITVEAFDRAGNTATVSVTVSLDKTSPSVSLSGPSTGRRGQTLAVSAPGSDNLALEAVVVSVDGVDGATLNSAPFQTNVTIPSNAAVGSFVTVTALARDRAGNTSSAAPFSIEVLGGGFVSGEVYDDTKGLPLAGATVSVNSQSVLTDLRGRFGLFTTDSLVRVRAERSGYTAVERVATVDQVSGTVVLDLRLTPLATGAVVTPAGGAVTSGSFTLTIPPGALGADSEIRLTEVSGLGLKNVLPLGWSPVGSVEIGPATSIPGATLRVNAEGLTGSSLVLVRYDESSNAWTVELEGLTGDTFVEAAIEETGAHAFLIADTGSTSPPPAVVGEELEGVEPVSLFFGLSASSEVTPAVSPVSPEAMALGSVVLFSPIELPSGTLVSALVSETFESLGEGTLVSEPFSQEMPLYRFPPRSDGELHQEFPVVPSRAFTLEEIREGRIHVEIGTAPSLLRGSLVGGEGQLVSGGGGADLEVPGGALAETVSVAVEGVDPLEVAVGFEGLTLVAVAEVELSGATLSTPGTLSIPVSLGSSENLYAARFLFVAGQRKLRLVGPASFVNGRISTPIDTGGTYLFFQSSVPLALVQGTVTEGGLPARLVLVESSTTPFMDITPDSGFYVVAAKLESTTLTARSLLTGNQGIEEVTPSSTATVSRDIALTTTGPFVTEATPPNGALGVSLSPSIRVTFSEPVDPGTVTTSSFSLSSTASVPGRIVLGSANRSASFLPDENLEPLTSYTLTAAASILDTSGNPLLPFTSSFTTLDDSIPELNPDALQVSFPDENGFVTVSAPEFSFEGNAAVTIVNLTNGIVVTGNVDPEGSLSFSIRASITDELQIRVLDSSDREIVIEKTEFRGPNGEVAIGRKGGKVVSGEFVAEIPEGALASASVFTLTPVEQAVLDALPVPDGTGGIGSGVEVNTGGAVLSKEGDLSFPVPPGVPTDAQHVVVRRVLEQGLDTYHVIDIASVVDGKVKTDSPPFYGFLAAGMYLNLWFHPTPAAKNPMGAITGIAREYDSSAVAPVEEPLAGVQVRVDETLHPGSFTATTDRDGRFVLFDRFFGEVGPTLNLVARDTNTPPREVRAVAFEDQRILSRFLTLTRFSRAGDVVFNFPLSPPPPPPSEVTISLFRKNGEARVAITNGFAAVGDELILKIEFTQPPEFVSIEVNGENVAVSRLADELVDGQTILSFEGTFTPQEARSYTVVAEGRDAFLNLMTARKSFLAAQGGAGNEEPLAGPPSIISDSAVPRNGDTGVPVTQVMSVQFTEPVTNVSQTTVTFEELGDAPGPIGLDILATKVGGTVGPVSATDEVVALTMTPRRGLKFGTRYKLTFSTSIVDTDLPPEGPHSLTVETNVIEFETFRPTKLGEAPLDATLVAMTTLDNYAFVALQSKTADGSIGNLEFFDLSDPTQPTKVGEDSLFIGSMVTDVDVEREAAGGSDILGVLSFNPRSGNSGLTLFDVSSRESPFPYAGFVTTVVPGEGSDFQVDLHEGFAYVAMGSGLKIVNLEEARNLFRAKLEDQTTPPIGTGSIPFEVSRGLFTRGVGFGQEAVENQVQISDASGDLNVSAVQVDGEATERVGYAGSFSNIDGIGRLTTLNLANTPAASILATVQLKSLPDLEGNTVHMSIPSDIALTDIDADKYAVVVGGPMVRDGRGTLAILKVTDPDTPEVLSVIELHGGWGTNLAIDEDGVTVFVSTSERKEGETTAAGGVEIYNLTNPAAPLFAGTIQDSSGDVALTSDLLVSANGQTAKVAAVGPGAFITGISPTGIEEQTNGAVVTTVPVTIHFLVTDDIRTVIASSHVQVLRNDVVEAVLPAVVTGTRGIAAWGAGSAIDASAGYSARALLTLAGGTQIASPTQPVPILTFDLSIDGDSTTYDLVAGSKDGVANYLPGQEGVEAPNITKKLLQDPNRKRFSDTAFQPQKMRLVTSALPSSIDAVTFVIENSTNYPGYSENTSAAEIEGAGREHDFSFNIDSDDISEEGAIDGIRAVVDFYCKDYGGRATVRADFRQGGDIITTHRLTIPVDEDKDGIADIYERQQIDEWNQQFGENLDPEDLTFFGPDRDPADAFIDEDKELRDPDGTPSTGPNLPPHKTSGDGLLVFEEYRGQVLDGGSDFEGGGHKRLSFARKELLIEVDVMGGVTHMPNRPGIMNLMNETGELFIGPERGAAVWLYFAIDDENLPHRSFPSRAGGTDTTLLRRYTRQYKSLLHYRQLLLAGEVTDPAASQRGGMGLRHGRFSSATSMVFVDQLFARNLQRSTPTPFSTLLIYLVSHELVHSLIDPHGANGFDIGDHLMDPDQDGNFYDANGRPHGNVPDPDDQPFLMLNHQNVVNRSSPRFSDQTRMELNLRGSLRR